MPSSAVLYEAYKDACRLFALEPTHENAEKVHEAKRSYEMQQLLETEKDERDLEFYKNTLIALKKAIDSALE